MTRRSTFPFSLLTVLSIALLQACGGGSDDHGSGNIAPGTAANTGSVSAPFNRSTSARYQLTGVGSQSFGVLSTSAQDASGAMTSIGSSVLSGSTSVKEIGGDASFAMGRWAAGTVTTTSGATTLTGTDNRAYHYIAINVPTVFPTSGTLTCDRGAFTTPTYTGGGNPGTTGDASGSATLTFSAGGATVGGTVSVSASGLSGWASLSGPIATPTSSLTTGAFFSNGTGAFTQIGDAGSGAYLLATSYAVTLTNGSRYIGVAKFRCN